ncbi:MAG: Gfo/Idh/MocA family oxidoreductase [Candidatus Symbiobacter sp.]|nr:Gfo/Idh/MocA family oxidoreductase [Candidatus Symbiobacter sp.]
MTEAFDPTRLRQFWPLPSAPRPIVTFGAGSITRDAHFPAYRRAGFPIAGLYDPDQAKATQLATQFGTQIFPSVAAAAAVKDAIFDLATPPDRHAEILAQLPDGAGVLIQKPLGSDLVMATEILTLCRRKNLRAAVNLQLRFAPMMLALADAVEQGMIGEVIDIDGWLALATPWHLWQFLLGLPRIELTMHSIHYIDWIRSLMGNPLGVQAKSLGHPNHQMAQTRTSAIFDYGGYRKASLSINHDHFFGRRHQACEFRVYGSQGAAYVQLGVNLDYPRGEPDILQIYPEGGSDWVTIPLRGAWFPEAFVSRMASLQRFVGGEEAVLVGSVEDAWHTMAAVEACFTASGGTGVVPLALPRE